MRSQFTVLTVLVAVSLIGAGCATKDWVRDLVGQERVQTDSQVAEVKGRLGTEAKRVDETAARVGEIEKSVAVVNHSVEVVNHSVAVVNRSVQEVSRSTQAAQERGASALSRAEQTDQRLTWLWAKRNEDQMVDAVEVLFNSNHADLDDRAQTTLLRVVRELRSNQNLKAELAGYADSFGTKEYNIWLSQQRAEAVHRFLVERGIELSRLNAIGLGVLSDASVPNDKKRRVTIRLKVPVAER